MAFRQNALIKKNALIKTAKLIPRPGYKVHKPVDLTLRRGLSHLNQHKFIHNFQDCLDPLCFLQYHYDSNIRSTLLNEFQSVYINLIKEADEKVVEVLLYG